ncbi:MAG TPA: ribonuclease R [Chthoniobacterales bacterium]
MPENERRKGKSRSAPKPSPASKPKKSLRERFVDLVRGKSRPIPEKPSPEKTAGPSKKRRRRKGKSARPPEETRQPVAEQPRPRRNRGKAPEDAPSQRPPGKSRQAPSRDPKKPRPRLDRPAQDSRPPRPHRDKPTRPSSAGRSLREQIVELVRAQPLDKVEISKRLNLPADDRRRLRELLSEMENLGEIARVRKDRYVVPQDADLFTGVIQFHASGAAHVLNEKQGEADLYVSAENTWTAMHGDVVVARINKGGSSEPWRKVAPGTPPRREGRVIRILKRANEKIVGTLQKSKNFFYVVADDPRFVHNLYVPVPAADLRASAGDKVVAKLDAWPSRHVNPEGHVIEVLGRTGAPGVDILSIIRKYNLPEKFPDDVVREAERIAPTVPPEEAARRIDLRDRFIITIDPDDAKDFDDAVEVQRTKNGWSVSVHIADVSHYVRPKTSLDREAVGRGNSVYLADRVIPMLPEALSNGICSLKPQVDRLAFSVFAEVSTSGKVHNVRFGKSVIRSAARLTYKEAFAILQKPPTDEVSRRVHTAWELSSLLRKQRFAKGSLELDFPEVKVWLDDKGVPVRLERIENDISHQLIEELMLFANECVARELTLARQPTVYRVHEKPDPDKLAEYRETAVAHGLRVGDLTNRDNLVRLLAATRGQSFENALKIGLLKSLKRATYGPAPLGHYGLAKENYTHFTSPIRRYADLIVHRSLERHLGLTKSGPNSTEIASLAEHISTTERVATDAERESTKLKKLEYFQRQTSSREGHPFPALILEVRNYGLFVELPEFLISGLVHVSTLDDDFYLHDAARGRFIGRKTKRVYEAGQTIEVIVAKVDMFKQQVDFKAV